MPQLKAQVRLTDKNAKRLEEIKSKVKLTDSLTKLANHILEYYGIPEFEKTSIFKDRIK